jgi:polygalacturonase
VTLEDVRFANSATWQLEHANVSANHSDVWPPLPGRATQPPLRGSEVCSKAFRDGNR